MPVFMRGRHPDYPESDGLPMADNTLQWQWIVFIKENLEILFRQDQFVFIASDLLWYPLPISEITPGDDELTSTAPDVMVVFGRPKGHYAAYLQWQEDGIPPQVTFEIRSLGITDS